MTVSEKPRALDKLAGLDPTDEETVRPKNGARFIWPIVCLFQLGLVAGLYVSRTGHDPAVPEGDLPQTARDRDSHSPAAETSDFEGSAAEFAQADDFLQRGWYEHALARYTASRAVPSGEISGALRFKMALCLEGLGHWDRAIAAYSEAAAGTSTDPIPVAARLARARLLYRMRNTQEARLAIRDLLLNSQFAAPLAPAVVEELTQLLGLTLAMEALGSAVPGPAHESTLAFPVLEWRPESQFNWTEPAAGRLPPAPENTPKKAGAVETWPAGPAPQDRDIAVTMLRGATSEIIDRVAEAAKIPCHWTRAARESADRRFIEISTTRLPWPTLVTCLTDPLRLSWNLHDGKLNLCGLEEVPPDDRPGQKSEIASLILLATVREGQHSPAAPVAFMGLGNLAFAEDQPEMAVYLFERLITEFPRSSQSVLAHFNAAIVRRSLGEYEAARTSFFHAVDMSPAHPLAPLMHLFVGRIHLDEFDAEGAIAPLRRAVTTATRTQTHSAAVMDLASALLLLQNWRAASALLLEQRSLLDQPELRDTAAFLATYARYQSLADRKQADREGQALVTSLMAIKAGSVLPDCGALLVGRAYAALGLGEQMVETFQQALRRGVPKPVAHEISLELAEFAVAAGNLAEARKHFYSVYRKARPAMSRRAGMRLAELALAERNTDDCLGICRKLLSEAEKADAAAILRLMGQAFEQTGDHQQAAQCFAGRPPAR